MREEFNGYRRVVRALRLAAEADDPDRSTVLAQHPGAAVHQRGDGARRRYAIVRHYTARGERVAFAGAWCRTIAAAWLSAARRIRENRPGPGGCGNR